MWQLAKKHKWSLFIIIIISLFYSAALSFGIYINFLLADLKNVKEKENNFNLLIILAISFFLVGAISFILKERLKNKLSLKIGNDLKENILQTIQKENAYSYNSKSKGFFLTWTQNHFETLQDDLVPVYFNFIENSISIIFYSFIALFISWKLALIALSMSLAGMIFPLFLSPISIKHNHKINEYQETYSKLSVSILENYSLFFYLNKKEVMTRIFLKHNEEKNNKIYKSYRNLLIMEIIPSLIGFLIDLSILVIIGYFVLYLNETIATIIILPSILSKVVFSFRMLLYGLIFKARLTPLVNQFQVKQENLSQNQEIQVFNEAFNSIEIKNLSFQFEEKNEYIFKNLNLKFEKGKKYAIVGRSGSGKSTLINLILKQIEDYEGEIKINNTNLKEMSNSQINNLFYFLDNKDFVFNDTVFNNISLWSENTKENHDKALQSLSAASYKEIDLTSVLNNENSSLSTGQKQRMNFAKHFYENKKILILDEALANVDKQNVLNIENQLFNNKELTLINITHHLKDKDKYDEIIELEKIKWS